MDTNRSEIWFFVAILVITIFLSWLVLAPYIGILVLAGTLAFLFQPLYQRLLRLFHNESVTALGTVLIIILIVFIPIGYFITKIVWEATGLYVSFTSNNGFDFGSIVDNFLSVHLKNLYIRAIAVSYK